MFANGLEIIINCIFQTKHFPDGKPSVNLVLFLQLQHVLGSLSFTSFIKLTNLKLSKR